MFLFLFNLFFVLLPFDVQPLIVNVNRLKTHTNSVIPGLGKYSDNPGVNWLIKCNMHLLVLVFTGLIGSTFIDGLKGLSVEGGVDLDDCYPLRTIASSLKDE